MKFNFERSTGPKIDILELAFNTLGLASVRLSNVGET
jgi:hypothetical protein